MQASCGRQPRYGQCVGGQEFAFQDCDCRCSQSLEPHAGPALQVSIAACAQQIMMVFQKSRLIKIVLDEEVADVSA